MGVGQKAGPKSGNWVNGSEHKPLETRIYLLNRSTAVRPPEKHILLHYVKLYTVQAFRNNRWANERETIYTLVVYRTHTGSICLV